MIDRDKCLIVIPARFGSTRLPGKPLISLCGKPMIQHVYERCVESEVGDSVIVATDDQRVFDAVVAFGGQAVMTSADCESGLDRVAEVAEETRHEYVFDVQGDEPLLPPDSIRALADRLGDPDCDMVTLATETSSRREAGDPHLVKVAVKENMHALFFSRSLIPSYFGKDEGKWLKHAGIYGFRREVLLDLSHTPPAALELSENLEQLRALEKGYRIAVVTGDWEFKGVDVEADVEEVEKMLSKTTEASTDRDAQDG